MPELTPQQFVGKWERVQQKESATAQSHFNDVCYLVGHPAPTDYDATGDTFTFEAGVKKTTGGQGFADVWFKGHFAIEYKGKGKYESLDDAYQQLLRYRENLDNPPLLIVCDIENWEIHTNFTGTEKRVYRFTNKQIESSTRTQRWLHWMFEDPYQFHPERTAAEVTADAADVFKQIAENMRSWEAEPKRIAHFLTKLVFCLFAEDVGLLPLSTGGRGLFTEIVEETRERPGDFVHYTNQLFQAMAEGGKVMLRDVRWFDGSLFDDVVVEPLSSTALTALADACRLDWSSVEPAIFGTLFERSLDPSKRAQLGAHYTSRDDILLIVEPVLMQPLRREWVAVQQEAAPIRAEYDKALDGGTRRVQQNRANDLLALRERMLERLRSVTVLDPACGSGNFLYVSLQLLKDLEKEVIHHELWIDLPLAFPEVHPRQLFGIEINPIAHDLASIVVWIGHLQWHYNNGLQNQLKREPILEPLHNIYLMDAILAFDEDGSPVEPEWPVADVIVSNPPFLGGNQMRGELDDEYVDILRELYVQRLPGQSNLVAYWFERSRAMIESGEVQRAGLLATSTIRQIANRDVLRRIKQTGDIFMAWSDREWVLDGAAVRISMVGFDNGAEVERVLDGELVSNINSDLTASIDLDDAQTLSWNDGLAFMGATKGGPFDISPDLARQMLAEKNPTGCPNSDVIRPWIKASGITGRPQDLWIIDFGVGTSLEEAKQYRAPFGYVEDHVLTQRTETQREEYRQNWWLHVRPRPEMRQAIEGLPRIIVTPLVSKHRVFVWIPLSIPDARLIVFARADDYFFGIIHSRIHEVWSLRKGARHGVGNDPTYNISTCFETFPLPWPPGTEPTDDPAYIAISEAAKQLNEERDAWLNPPGAPERVLRDRTLTNLYNALLVFRNVPPPEGKTHPRIKQAAGDFAPRLHELHQILDHAVCDAYRWDYGVLDDDEEILRLLLALNLERAAANE